MSNARRNWFRNKLDPELRPLLEALEEAVGTYLIVQVEKPDGMFKGERSAMAVIAMPFCGMAIDVERPFDQTVALHELLHLTRWFVEETPIINLTGRQPLSMRLENCSEHLVIVPLQERYGKPEHDFWNESTRREIQTYEEDQFVPLKVYTKSQWLKMTWLNASLANDPTLSDQIVAHLHKLNLTEDFAGRRSKLLQLLHSKIDFAEALCIWLGIPASQLGFVRFSRAERKMFNLTKNAQA